jgi:hypothetical protein
MGRPQVCHVGGAAGNLKEARDPGSHRQPGGPEGPCGPCALGGPAGPCGPCAPGGPVGPCGPSAPPGPAGPCGPSLPPGPAGPCGPCAPGGPAGPCGPSLPPGPAGPCGPDAGWPHAATASVTMRTETLNSWRIGRPFGVDATLVSASEDSQETMETVEDWLEASASAQVCNGCSPQIVPRVPIPLAPPPSLRTLPKVLGSKLCATENKTCRRRSIRWED